LDSPSGGEGDGSRAALIEGLLEIAAVARADESLSPARRALEQLPPHLRRYGVEQEYASYTPRDHAVWRHVVRRLVRHLAERAHPSYLAGLAATGIGTERVPSMDEMNSRLAVLGWSAVCVRGFIPPAVFTELQSLRVLAIAADVRSHEHVEYTPAPDIVHESAGHAPILADPDYAAYLQKAGQVGFRAIASAEDGELYEAIRRLSVVKEDPLAAPGEVAAAERRLAEASAARREPSESAKASRLYWWTAEYGLVGDSAAPRIYGAGLLSSIGESAQCLSPAVERVPLTLACVEQDYDITRMQPRLFVARDFAQLLELAERFALTLSWRTGGDRGLAAARAARTVNHLALEGGLEVSGVVDEVFPAPRPTGPGLSAGAAVVGGPCQISRGGRRSRALGAAGLVAFGRCGCRGRASRGWRGLRLDGRVLRGREVVELRGRVGSRELPLPPRALVLSSGALPSVAGGPADPASWDGHLGRPAAEGEGEARARARKAEALPDSLARLYEEVRAMRQRGAVDAERLAAIEEQARAHPEDWLLRQEIQELRR
jgi:phenylalanine-4-hydroxylase